MLGLALARLRGTADRPVFAMLAVWAVGITLAYLATPYNLGWHLACVS